MTPEEKNAFVQERTQHFEKLSSVALLLIYDNNATRITLARLKGDALSLLFFEQDILRTELLKRLGITEEPTVSEALNIRLDTLRKESAEVFYAYQTELREDVGEWKQKEFGRALHRLQEIRQEEQVILEQLLEEENAQ